MKKETIELLLNIYGIIVISLFIIGSVIYIKKEKKKIKKIIRISTKILKSKYFWNYFFSLKWIFK